MLVEAIRWATGEEDPAVTAARINAESAERVARMGARAASYAAQQERIARRTGQAMEMSAMQEAIRQQREAAHLQRLQTEKLAAKEELRFAVGEATKDSYEKVTNAFVSWAQTNNTAEEQMLRSQFGLNEDHRFDAPIQEPSMYDMANVDLLTGATVDNDNPYQFSSDADNEMNGYVDRLYPDQMPSADDLDIRDEQLLGLINEWTDGFNRGETPSELPPDPNAQFHREEE
ncbi:MAG: hypothetical protein HYT76_04980 [Deltaproteobacteria bacterium]|nr:hypothetical protein [Deltaproteobacteria bacterium]